MLAIHRVVTAKTLASRPTCRATASPTGVSSTAVVSSESTTVQPTASRAKSSHSAQARCRPACATQWPATSNTPARSATSAVTVMARRKTTTGQQPLEEGDGIRRGHAGHHVQDPGGPAVRRLAEAHVEAAGHDVAQGRAPSGASTPTWQRCRATSPRVCLAMWLAPGTRTCTQRGARSAPGRHAAAYGADRQSTTTPRPATAGSTSSSAGRQSCGERAEPGQRRAHREPVGGDPVARAHRPVEGGDDDQPAVGAAAGGGVEAWPARARRRARRCRPRRPASRARCRARGCAPPRRAGRGRRRAGPGPRGSG